MKTDTSEIAEVFKDFYWDLYTQDYINEIDEKDNFLRDIVSSSLNQEEKEKKKNSSLLKILRWRDVLLKRAKTSTSTNSPLLYVLSLIHI